MLANIRRGVAGYPTRGCIDLLAGGSPCQPYSLANSCPSADDERNDLSFQFLELLELLDPAFFLLENVGGWLTGRGHSYDPAKVVPSPMPRVVSRLIGLGYQVRVVTLCSAHYAVPQSRRRCGMAASNDTNQLQGSHTTTCRCTDRTCLMPGSS